MGSMLVIYIELDPYFRYKGDIPTCHPFPWRRPCPDQTAKRAHRHSGEPRKENNIVLTRVSDPFHLDTDPDPT